MTIGQKIIFSSTLVAILAGLAAFMGWKNTQPIRTGFAESLVNINEEIEALGEVKTSIVELQMDLLEVMQLLNSAEPEDRKGLSTKQRQLLTKVDHLGQQVETISSKKENPQTQVDIADMLTGVESLKDKIGLLIQDDTNGAHAVVSVGLITDTRQLSDDLLKALVKAKNQRFAFIEQTGIKVETQIDKLNFWMILVGGLTFFLAIVFGRVIAAELSKSLDQLRLAAVRLNKGDYSTRVGMKSKDEFGRIAKTFDNLAANLEQSELIEQQKSQLEALNVQLKTKNDSLDSFVYRVSHDLKAPVLNIRSLLTLLKSKIDINIKPEVNQSFFFLEKSSEKLSQTISDLLEVSRIEQSLETTQKWIDLEHSLFKLTAENSELIAMADVTVSSNFSASRQIYFSETNLDSILANLLTNSIKYRSDQRPPVIHLETQIAGDFTCLSISDNGLGIDLEKHGERLFGMFNRFHNHVEGSGVGLYIVKKLIEEASGKVEVESQPGIGTTFKVYIPRQETKVITQKVKANYN